MRVTLEVRSGLLIGRRFDVVPGPGTVFGRSEQASGFIPHDPEIAFTAGVIGLSLVIARDQGELGEWFASSWGYAKQILPLLLGGVLIAGLLLQRCVVDCGAIESCRRSGF